jgi:RNA polymerase sigma-70 factor (ECF subfamily)
MVSGSTTQPGRQEDLRNEQELRALMVRYQNADAEAVAELVGRLSPALLRYFSGPFADRAEAQDLLQECWLRIHRSRHTYRPAEPVLPWIFAIARHTRVDGYRRRRRLLSREVQLAGGVAEPSQAPPSGGGMAEFSRLLAALPESQREVIWMLKVSGMSLEEVARATSSTVGAIKQKAHRAYAKLRQVLEKEQNRERRTNPSLQAR